MLDLSSRRFCPTLFCGASSLAVSSASEPFCAYAAIRMNAEDGRGLLTLQIATKKSI
jgi:hypothetical protein